jgi:hypothetical protein
MPRIPGRSVRQAAPLPAPERYAQIRAMMEAGTTNPADMARTLGCSKEAVLYHARRMPGVELRRVTAPGALRWHLELFFTTRPTQTAPEASAA